MTTFVRLSALSLFSLLKRVPCRDCSLNYHAAAAAAESLIEAGAGGVPTHDSSRRTFTIRDHPPPQRLSVSGDSAASPRRSGRPAQREPPQPRWSLTTSCVLSSAAADDDDAGGRAGDCVQYTRLRSRQGCNHTRFFEVRGGCVWGSVLATTCTRAVI